MIHESLNIAINNIHHKNIEKEPFSFFYINNIFPEEFYKLIHKNWPETINFENGKKLGGLEAERFYSNCKEKILQN